MCARATRRNGPTDRRYDHSRHFAATLDNASDFRDAPRAHQYAQIVSHSGSCNSNPDILAYSHAPSHRNRDGACLAFYFEAARGIARSMGA